VTQEWLQLKIEGPRGTVAQAQILARVRGVPALMREAMWSLGHTMRRLWLARQFKQEGRYLGSGWDRLSPQYLQWKIDNGWFTDIGKRTGAMIATFTGGEKDAVSMSGPGGSTITGTPSLWYSDKHVKIGGYVREDGHEYAQHFDLRRHIFGEGTLPQEVELEGGKILTLPHLSVVRGGEMGDPRVDDSLNVRNEIRQFVRGRLLREAEKAVA